MSNITRFITDKFKIIDKSLQEVPFIPNKIQTRYLESDMTQKDVILKARQQGFSSAILAKFTKSFLHQPNSVNVVVADVSDNAKDLLARVKLYLGSYGQANGFDVEKELLKYNSKYELHNRFNNARYIIGTAEAREFGRSKTITNLHLSEFAFYPDPEKLLAGALQAVVPSGEVIIETTANGFNYFKDFWDRSVIGETGFNALFYPASDFYDPDFLKMKRRELSRTYSQEYPETPEEAFIASGDYYFDRDAMQYYLDSTANAQAI